MKLDINEAIRDVLDFLKAHWRPPLVKYIIWPSMTVGLASLSVPLWIGIANQILVQNFFPDYKLLLQPNYPLGALLIGLSVIVYFLDVWLKKSSNQSNQLKELPSQVADEIAARMKSSGFTAPHLQDEKIEKLVHEIALLRFFSSFPTEAKATVLAEYIIHGELSGATPRAKARALALLARYLCVGQRAEQAKNWLLASIELCQTEEAEIAQALFAAIEANDVNAASGLLKANSPSSYSAFFIIKKIVEKNELALSWFERSGLSIQDLNTDGKIALIAVLLSERQWETALNIVQSIGDEHFSTSPALAQLSAFTFLVNAIKTPELREGVMSYIPFAAERFPLSDDFKSIELRNRAVELFKVCSSLARNLGAKDVANIMDNYVLWLELRNSETHEQAKAQLQSYFVNYNQKTLEYLPMAFAFGIDIDFESVEKEVNRQAALSNDNDPILGLARFVLAQANKSFSEVVEYIASYRKQLVKTVNPIAIGMLEVEALARAGLVDDAESILQKMEASGAPEAEVRNLQSIIASARGKDPIALAITQYQQSNATSDLSNLVSLLEKGELKEKYYLYCRELFERTGQKSDAIRVCNAASSLGKYSELHQFLSDRMDIVKISEGLQAHWAWSLFRKGDLSGSHEQIAKLKHSKAQQPYIKDLEINLAIFGGDWESLVVFVEEKWNSREGMDAANLLQAALLAKAVAPSRAKQILEFATQKFPEDPQVLASSYFTAAKMGWEDQQEASEWLNRAIALSTEDGPVRGASYEDIKEMLSDAASRDKRIYKAYSDGVAPICTVADLLNRSMSDIYLIQPFENKKTKDIRQKNIVAVFHGARTEQVIIGKTIVIDVSSALVMESVGTLEHIFDCFEQVVIPHSFMQWLFEEKQKVSFHQPSRIERAKYIERLVSDGRLAVFNPQKIINPELALDVGDELACMLEEAQAHRGTQTHAFVVSSYPIFRVDGTFREVELTEFHDCLISCSQLIKRMEASAVITQGQCSKALDYLTRHEREWADDLEVPNGAKLLLDSVSIDRLIEVELLESLCDAGFEVCVYSGERIRYKSLINYDVAINTAGLILENIRKKISSGIKSGKVVLSEMSLPQEQAVSTKDKLDRSIGELFEAIKLCDAALVDDRFMNRHRSILFDKGSVPVFTSLDYINTLYHRKLISIDQKFEYRTLLREYGYEFVNISSEELEHHLRRSVIVDGVLKTTRHLKLIKESLLLIRISNLVNLPRDAEWLRRTLKMFTEALVSQWSSDSDLELRRARSSWLYDLIGYREWAQAHQVRDESGMAQLGEYVRINSILMVPESIPAERRAEYRAWLDEFVLAPLKDLDPLSFKHLVDSIRNQVENVARKSELKEALSE